MSYSSMAPNTLDSPGTLSPLAGPSERSAYDQLMALARYQSSSPLSSETPGAPTSPSNTPGSSFGAPASGNFGQDAMDAGRAMGQAALGMAANPAGIPGSVVGTMTAAALRGATNQPQPISLRAGLGLTGLVNALTGAIRGQPSISSMFGDQTGSKPSGLSAEEAQSQMAGAMANNDFGGQKSDWGGPDYGGGDKGAASNGGSKGDSAAAAAQALGGNAGGSQSGAQDSGGASGANLAGGGLVGLASGGTVKYTQDPGIEYASMRRPLILNHPSSRRSTFTDRALRYLNSGEFGLNNEKADDYIEINPMEDFGVEDQNATIREQSIPPDISFFEHGYFNDEPPGMDISYRRGRQIEPSRDFAAGGSVVRGLGSGLDDLVPTTINGRRAAALSDGEFVVPADVVSMMGDGSTDAGARRLYDFMNTVRQHKTGTTEQAGPLPIGDILKRSLR